MIGYEGKEHVRIDDDGADHHKRDELREPEDVREDGGNNAVGK